MSFTLHLLTFLMFSSKKLNALDININETTSYPEKVSSDQTFKNEDLNEYKVLSRRKRFLVFPDGSSFQLVFCTQNHGYLQIGDIVWFGNTVALAWELPSDSKLFYNLKEYKNDFAQRREDYKHIYYLAEDGKILAKVPYKRRKLIINPAFAKRSIRDESGLVNLKEGSSTKRNKRNHDLLKNLDQGEIEFHRNGRKSLYGKIEILLNSLGYRGEECVLRILCESGARREKRGNFFEEVISATFTLPEGRTFGTADQEKYDTAYKAGLQSQNDNYCLQLYRNCEQ